MRVTYFNSILAVSVLLLTIACTAVPSRADVNITVAEVGEPYTGRVQISYDATTETNLVRAFAFDIQLDNDANIIEVTGISPDYYIYPGTIQIDASGNVIDYGTALADYNDLPGGTLSGLDSNGITIEMASLYAPVGPGSPNAPAKSGVLAEIIVDKSTCLTISANLARAGAAGVVMEAPDEVVTVNYPPSCICIGCVPPPPGCLKDTDPGYEIWLQYGKFDCWCYRHQCQGDADGLETFGRYVALADLNMIKAGFGKTPDELLLVTNGFCCDFNHIMAFGRPCGLDDLNILKENFGKVGLPDCPMTHINYWEEP